VQNAPPLQDNAAPDLVAEPETEDLVDDVAAPGQLPPGPVVAPQQAPAPLFRDRTDLAQKPAGDAGRPITSFPPIIPIVRPPDDPGVDDADGGDRDEFAELNGGQQVGGWRGFLRRWGG
jgi:HemY protein